MQKTSTKYRKLSPTLYKKNDKCYQMAFILSMHESFNIHKSINVLHHINKLKKKNHTNLSIHVKKVFDNPNTYL